MNNLVIATDKTITVVLQDKLDSDGRPTTIFIDSQSEGVKYADLLEMTSDEVIKRFGTVNVEPEDAELNHAIQIYKELDSRTKIEFLENNGVFQLSTVPGLSIPKELFIEMMSAFEDSDLDRIESLKLFWMRCALNNNPESRDDLFAFLKENGFKITPFGFFLTYRNVNELWMEYNGSVYSGLYGFIKEAKKTIKSWKQSPSKVFVMATGHRRSACFSDAKYTSGYTLVRKRALKKYKKTHYVIGSLQELLDAAPECAVFTDQHTGKHRIRIGKTEELNRKDCDYSNGQACSSGLHVGTPDFISSNAFGDTSIAVLVNPTDVVAVPQYDRHKMRVCRYMPVAFIDGKIKDIDLTNIEHEYSVQSSMELINAIRTQTLIEVEAHRIMPQEISFDAFNIINRCIEWMSNNISDRVSKVS